MSLRMRARSSGVFCAVEVRGSTRPRSSSTVVWPCARRIAGCGRTDERPTIGRPTIKGGAKAATIAAAITHIIGAIRQCETVVNETREVVNET